MEKESGTFGRVVELKRQNMTEEKLRVNFDGVLLNASEIRRNTVFQKFCLTDIYYCTALVFENINTGLKRKFVCFIFQIRKSRIVQKYRLLK